ncbi:MAG: hypothetical protein NZO16_02020, partial [Deltaproteobacteria bacterium]|nr:hypothetical protein [Deltaproteobacteria bacterium]
KNRIRKIYSVYRRILTNLLLEYLHGARFLDETSVRMLIRGYMNSSPDYRLLLGVRPTLRVLQELFNLASTCVLTDRKLSFLTIVIDEILNRWCSNSSALEAFVALWIFFKDYIYLIKTRCSRVLPLDANRGQSHLIPINFSDEQKSEFLSGLQEIDQRLVLHLLVKTSDYYDQIKPCINSGVSRTRHLGLDHSKCDQGTVQKKPSEKSERYKKQNETNIETASTSDLRTLVGMSDIDYAWLQKYSLDWILRMRKEYFARVIEIIKLWVEFLLLIPWKSIVSDR